MRAIIVDDEIYMIHKFTRLMAEVGDIVFSGCFEHAEDALDYVKKDAVEVAFLDAQMPEFDGIELAKALRAVRSDILIVFVTAHEDYIHEFNKLGGDLYILKPYTKEILRNTMEKLRLLAAGQRKKIYVQMFGRFIVKKNGRPVPLNGKAKEILALVISKRGHEISNEEIYSTIWEGRPYSNSLMSVYYNAVRRLKTVLREAGIDEILVSTSRGQMADTNRFDCDYYDWQDRNPKPGDQFAGDFLPEYSWGEVILASILREEWGVY